MKAARSIKRTDHMTNRVISKTGEAKLPVVVNGYKGAVEQLTPAKFRGFIYMPEFNMTADAFGESIEAVTLNLALRAEELKVIVPERQAVFTRIEELIDEKFGSRFNAYQFLNGQQKEWRSASSERLLAIISILEDLEASEEKEWRVAA